MSKDLTQEFPDARSFEERVFARFDALDTRLSGMDARLSQMDGRLSAMDGRLTSLEEKVDARLHDTRPIWEAVLSRLDKIEDEVKSIKRQMKVLHEDVLQVREEQVDLDERVTKLEAEPSR
ncbi:MAG: hypothetical protein WBP93_11155 [Pyrinomonadaceae bacterium]